MRVGIYRGYLINGGSGTIPLCGESLGTSTTAVSPAIYVTGAINAVAGQNLSFAAGEHITVAFHSSGSLTVFPKVTGIADLKIAYNANFNAATAGFNTSYSSLTSSHILSTQLDRLCFELT